MKDYEPDADEVMAGVEIFNNFGFFPTMMSLSRKMGVSYDEVLEMPADVVYMTMLIDFESSEYEKRLYEVKSGKPK